jgi:antitoxin component YwqK of YwqJK toxin-antitoxin module
MIKQFILILVSFLFAGCESKLLVEDETISIEIEDLQFRSKDGEELLYAPNSTNPFTGKIQISSSTTQILASASVKDGMLNGLWTSWYENGQMKSQGLLLQGRLTNEGGLELPCTNASEDINHNGVLDPGEDYFGFSPNGLVPEKLKSDGKLQNMEILQSKWGFQGEWKSWYKDGQLRMIQVFKDGKLISVQVMKPSGQICEQSQLSEGQGRWVWYWDEHSSITNSTKAESH